MTMAEILLINPYPESACGINEGTIEPPLGIGYLAAIAENNNIPCEVIDANVLRMKIDSVLSEVKRYTPRIVGISVNLYSYQISLKLADRIKDYFSEIIVILGGAAPSSMPLAIMNACKADAVVVGEGEETFSEILHNYRNKIHLFKKVKGTVYKDGEKIVTNEPRGFLKDIDTIPFPAYHLFPGLNMYKSRSRKNPIAPLLTSRGCPYQCIFCSKDVFRNICRLRSAENVIKEIDMLVGKYGVKQIDILDDNFLVNKERAEKILDFIIERNYDLGINFQSGICIEDLDRNIIDKMKKAKAWKLAIGVESGDKAMLARIKKNVDLSRILEVVRILKDAGIKVYGFFIIGLPGDNSQSMQKTIDFAIKMNPDVANFCMAIPFPGTELYELIKKEGKFLVNMDNGINSGFYANEVFYEIGNMDKTTVLRFYKKAFRDFYLRPRKILELMIGINSWAEARWLFNTGFFLMKSLWKKDILKS
jgi:radical SAM superfamily enzyme YgiQ (UPF0313 family)